MLKLAVSNPLIDPRLFLLRGSAVLTWHPDAHQPVATVTTGHGGFVSALRGAPEDLRDVIAAGAYEATYATGFVTIEVRPGFI